MTLPMPDEPGANPEESPCEKPKFDSSGGYGNQFYMNYMLIKTPSEHTWQGKRFDAEIQMGFFRYSGSDPSIFGGPPYTVHILVNSGVIQKDNPILQPYLNEWKRISDSTLKSCLDKFGYDPNLSLESDAPTHSPAPSLSSAPSAAPTTPKQCAEASSLDSLTNTTNGGLNTRMSGIMFDVLSKVSSGSVEVNAFDVNMRIVREADIEIWTKSNTWLEGESYKNSTLWTQIYAHEVIGAGANNPTRVTLSKPIVLVSGETQAFYIVMKNENDLYNIPYNTSEVGIEMKSDSNLQLLVGQGINGDAFTATEEEDFQQGRGFSGVIHYSVCFGGRSGRRNLRNFQRHLDHEYIDNWNDRKKKNPIDFSTLVLPWDPFRLWPSPWYVRYRGSLTMPQCFDETRVRILDRPLQISKRQLDLIDELIATMRDPVSCNLATVGRPRGETGLVDVNRPIQRRNGRHELKYCDDGDFGHADFFFTPRGNTCWCLLDGSCKEGCDIDCAGNCAGLACDEYWPPNQPKWTAERCPDN